MRLCAYQPDFPHNLGGLIRLGVCFGAAIDVVEPCGFPFSTKAARVSGLDYVDKARIDRHASWAAFVAGRAPGRLVLLTTSGDAVLWEAALQPEDTLVLGRETAGAPPDVHAAADLRLRIPLRGDARSLNVVAAAAIALGEAERQSRG